MFDPDYRGDITGRDFAANPRIRPDMPQADLERLIALYDGEIRYADEHLSRILDHLRDLGELDQTVIAVTSDHGDEFLEHGFHGHRQTLYDEVLLAPLVVRYPAEIEADVVVSEPIRLIDVGLTLLELAGVDSFRFGPESDNLYSARSAASLLQAGAPRDEAPRLAFLDLEGGLLRAVRTPDKKYITMNGGEETWVFDLSADPDETKNLALEDPQRTAALGALVSEWSGQADPEAGVERVQMAPEQVKVLRSLGYIQ
jgi:arylsulfatase A-like enzyme